MNATSKGLAEALFQEASDALFLFDPDTDQMRDVNAMAEKMTGFSRQELLDSRASQLFRFPDPAGSQRLHDAAGKTKVFHAQDGYFLRIAGNDTWLPVNLSITRLHVEPAPLALVSARDMTEQHEAYARLRKMEAELRQVLESVSDCLWSAELTPEGKWVYRYLSPGVESISGRPPQFFLNELTRWLEVIHPEDRKTWLMALDRSRSGRNSQIEYRILMPDGEIRWLRESVRSKATPDGASVHLDGIVTDVTEHRRAEERLHEERLLLKTLIENMPDIIYLKDLEGRYLIDNRSHRQALGVREENEVLGKQLDDFFPTEVAATFVQNDLNIMANGTTVQYVLESITDREGKTLLMEFTKVPIRDSQGLVCGLIGIGRDVTTQREAEKVLARDRKLLRTLMDNLPDQVFIKDRESRFLLTNPATLANLGYTHESEVLGKTDHDLMPGDIAEQFLADERKVLEEGISLLNYEELLVNWKGQSRWFLTSKIPLRSPDGSIFGLVGIGHDITRRRAMESELRRALVAAEQANHAKSEFLARMSHEIRTPMCAVIGLTEVALETTLTSEQRNCLNMVLTSAEALLNLINGILDFSRIEAGKLPLESAPFALRDHLSEAVRTLSVKAHEKKLELAYQVAPDVPEMVVGDQGRLRQIMVNLVGNAIKFTETGEVVVRVERIADSSESPDRVGLHFSVKDTGIGIPADKRSQIFQPFEQADGSFKRKFEGSGLGLAIASQLVHLMGGEMWVESEVDRGSCFHFKLFLDIPDSSEPPRTLQPSPDMLGMRVLVVEDNATQGSILEETLLTWRMQPTILHDASAALQEIQDAEKDGDPYSVVLIDSRMPSPGGYALAESIQKRAYGLNGIVMLATPAESALHAEKHRQLGLPSCVLKPIKQSELLHTLLAISTKSQAISAPPVRSKNQADYAELPPLQILLAEDTQVNQTLAVRILEKAGHSVHVAPNGLLVLEYLQNKTCDLILMDLQMPELGGLETTIRIREQEKQTGKHLPIIALTAHAMKGDRERCLEAGMDGYVSKPIRTRELFQVMEQVLRNFAVHLFDGDAPRLETPEQSSPSSLDTAHSEPFNRSQALDHCGGDPQLLQELIDMFLLEIDGWLSHLSSALASGNTKEVTRMAHTIKGSVGTFAAARCYQLSLDMEILGKTNRLPEAPLLRDQLQEELAKLKLALREYHPSS